ncbi:MAG: ribokinase [Eggerthellaceae bacterium]|jgi:ribokinase
MPQHQVIVFGSLNMDLSIECDRAPLIGETLLGRNFITNPGGKGANQAVAAAKLGGCVHMLGAVGSDPFGDQMVASLAEAGVRCERIAVADDAPTGVAVIERIGGDNCIIVDSGANLRPDTAYVESRLCDIARPGDVFLAQLECDFDTTMAALACAHEKGLCTVLNPAPARELPLSLYPCLDVIAVNETECEMLTGVYPDAKPSIERALDVFRERGARCAVITLGERGSVLGTADSDTVLAAEPLQVEALDTTCAGDTYLGAFVAARADGATNEEAMDLATRASALAITRVGAQQSIPTRAEADALDPVVVRPL